jgi:hypothetical protein
MLSPTVQKKDHIQSRRQKRAAIIAIGWFGAEMPITSSLLV